MNEFALMDHPGWAVLQQHIARNVPEYITFALAVAVAAVCTMPEKCPFIVGEPTTRFEILVQQGWSWLRNTMQTAVPAARASTHSSAQTITQTPTVTKVETTASSTEPPKTMEPEP